jgi:hypothetical protein
MQLNLEDQEVAHVINILAKLPNESMTFPIVLKMKEQYDAATAPVMTEPAD